MISKERFNLDIPFWHIKILLPMNAESDKSLSFSSNRCFERFYGLEDISKLLIVPLFQVPDLFLKVFVGEDILSELSKCPDNLNIHMDRFLAV